VVVVVLLKMHAHIDVCAAAMWYCLSASDIRCSSFGSTTRIDLLLILKVEAKHGRQCHVQNQRASTCKDDQRVACEHAFFPLMGRYVLECVAVPT